MILKCTTKNQLLRVKINQLKQNRIENSKEEFTETHNQSIEISPQSRAVQEQLSKSQKQLVEFRTQSSKQHITVYSNTNVDN